MNKIYNLAILYFDPSMMAMNIPYLDILSGVQLDTLLIAQVPILEGKASLLNILSRGGFMMYPLILLSVIMGMLIVIYLITIRSNTLVSNRFMEVAETMIRRNNYLGLVDYCQTKNETISKVTERALEFIEENPQIEFAKVQEVAGAEASRQVSIYNARITFLADIGALAPMLGLLGTVFGMIKLFSGINPTLTQSERYAKMTEGMANALITTGGGLIIAIIALTFYSIFRSRVQKGTAELELATNYLFTILHDSIQNKPASSSSSRV